MGLVEYTVSDAVARITLNRPPVNALNAELIADISAALEQAVAPSVRAVVITGSPHFAAGGFDGFAICPTSVVAAVGRRGKRQGSANTVPSHLP